ncbi:hypothetical protein PROFUN_10297 [Planoprotostelium fungivorum]|uniref:Uncharacterized protein n=1 Tax=Planoprotostelium fungivorum TaxID=1890364 RepID=A0A2P6MRR4_9EUKA|nr:hypothetical protein PROFUN_10297 [Planoprotostelium fungivorum]
MPQNPCEDAPFCEEPPGAGEKKNLKPIIFYQKEKEYGTVGTL